MSWGDRMRWETKDWEAAVDAMMEEREGDPIPHFGITVVAVATALVLAFGWLS